MQQAACHGASPSGLQDPVSEEPGRIPHPREFFGDMPAKSAVAAFLERNGQATPSADERFVAGLEDECRALDGLASPRRMATTVTGAVHGLLSTLQRRFTIPWRIKR